jgi:arylsulfatase A-like enzyme
MRTLPLAAALTIALAAGPAAAQAPRPNFVVVVTDDQRADTLNATFMPRLEGLLHGGVRFERGYVTTPLCAPSRASILTGRYAHSHGVEDNQVELGPAFQNSPKFPRLMHDSGFYRTALVGKYLNQWPGGCRPAAWDYWVAIPGGGVASYTSYDIYKNNQNNCGATTKTQYITNYLRDEAVAFLGTVPADSSFLLVFTPVAPHGPATPAAQDRDLYVDPPLDPATNPPLPPYRPASFNEADVSDKPPWLANRPRLTAAEIAGIDTFGLHQLQTLAAVDRAVQAIADEITRLGRLSNTVFLFIGDNGYFWGEHRLEAKNRVYEEAVRVPFAVRDMRRAPNDRVDRRHLVANIDLAPTILELAGLPIPPEMEGRSLAPLLAAPNPGWRIDLQLEGSPQPPFDGLIANKVEGCSVREAFVKYVESSRDEFYDLETDPAELSNVAQSTDPATAALVERYRSRLHQLPH